MSNPLLAEFKTPFEVPPFEQISSDHYLEGLELALKEAEKEIEVIVDTNELPTFENTIVSLERAGSLLQRNSAILFNLNSAETNDQIQSIAQEISPQLTAFSNAVKQNPDLFERVKYVYNQRDSLDLSTEDKKLLHETYFDFVRRGVQLEGPKKERFGEISIELSQLSLTYGERLLHETNAFQLIVDDQNDLAGLPPDVKARAKSLAVEHNKPDSWIFTLQAPSYLPFMEYADNRELREKMYRAFMSKCFHRDEYDNQELIIRMAQLRAELAEILGYSTYADFVLEQRMAEKPSKVESFLQDLLRRSLPKARREVQEIEAFMKKQGAEHELQRWDWAYYSEKLRREKYELDDELVKPYFLLENVIQGVFQTAEKLFGISFKKRTDLPKYHPDVDCYEVAGKDEQPLAIFLADFFPRNGKRGGAWMTSFRGEKRENNARVIPQVSIVCNFTPSSDDNPSLLKFDEVKTLFHEFGHALHGMLADTNYESLSGTSVYWDFVELPSQIMENWCFEKECLDLFARHYQTGETIPEQLIDKIRKSSTYHEAYATLRQISFGLLDMAWHNQTLASSKKILGVDQFESNAFGETDLFPKVDGTNMSVQFSHIFAGGYAAGYYSYKWAEVLDADAFSLFQENGVFDQETARAFKEHILSRGGTEHPMTLYKRFRGQEPKIDALLQRAGLSES